LTIISEIAIMTNRWLWLSIWCLLVNPALAAEPTRPNIVMILADDQGWGDLSLHGNQQLQTPHIDSIAKQGAEIKHFYVCAVCSPTRAEMLTGRYYLRTGVRGVSTGEERLNLDETTLPQLLKQAGYATGCFGKWHNGSQWPYHPNARGFDQYYGFTSGHWGEYFDPPLERNGEPTRGRGFIVDDLTNEALKFIEQHHDRPFFCYLPVNVPHSPFAVPDQYWQRHRQQEITQQAGDQDLDQTRCALAMCENLDDNVGRILKKLDELKLAENTIVVYFSDNGPNTNRYNGGMKGKKGSVDEGGLRVPCLIRWSQQIKPGTIVEQVGGAIDLLPTLCALTNTKLPTAKPLDGRDLSPLLLGKDVNWPERMLFSSQGIQLAVRTSQYRWTKDGLYDLQKDPGQQRNLSKEQPALAQQLQNAAEAWRKEVAPLTKPEPRPFPVGYRQFPRTPLPARDGIAHGNVRRSSNAPNCSYFVNWKSKEDRITWHVEVATTGDYEVLIDYTCPVADAGSLIQLSLNKQQLQGRVEPGWDPPLYTNQDTITRPKGESTMKEFRTLKLGTIRLEAGTGQLTLQALEIPGQSVMDVRRVTLILK
jgi:arylsulfatase A-like enzyme